MNNKLADWMLILGIWIIALAQIWVTLGNRERVMAGQTYDRATNCFAATSPPNRTPEYVKQCYEKAESATGIRVERYGDGR